MRPYKLIMIRNTNVYHNAYLSDVDTSISFSQGMSVAQLGNNRYGVETRVLSQSCGDDFEGVCIGLEAVCLHALQ